MPLPAIAEAVGTPVYVYSTATIERHVEVFKAALAGVDRCAREVMATVEELRRGGEDILFLVGSDHGHETIGAGVSIEAWMAERGLGLPREPEA